MHHNSTGFHGCAPATEVWKTFGWETSKKQCRETGGERALRYARSAHGACCSNPDVAVQQPACAECTQQAVLEGQTCVHTTADIFGPTVPSECRHVTPASQLRAE